MGKSNFMRSRRGRRPSFLVCLMHTFPTLFVACLCAQWCGTCRDYQSLFEQLRHEFPQAHWHWVDIEDQADVVDPVEVENFPTVLIAHEGRAQFFGTITPHLDTLRRLIHTHSQGATPLNDAAAQALLARLLARPQPQP